MNQDQVTLSNCCEETVETIETLREKLSQVEARLRALTDSSEADECYATPEPGSESHSPAANVFVTETKLGDEMPESNANLYVIRRGSDAWTFMSDEFGCRLKHANIKYCSINCYPYASAEGGIHNPDYDSSNRPTDRRTRIYWWRTYDSHVESTDFTALIALLEERETKLHRTELEVLVP